MREEGMCEEGAVTPTMYFLFEGGFRYHFFGCERKSASPSTQGPGRRSASEVAKRLLVSSIDAERDNLDGWGGNSRGADTAGNYGRSLGDALDEVYFNIQWLLQRVQGCTT
jgi:hypothetical protein